ncbi:hypothetical protein J1N09_06795 [Aureitalea sp. L0-47]|uniref:hypothetical protein n=1 Tax=Aureitalea sp. L0-47 TaxID=2816962 RepID=UPI002238262A|nr:hypothetical protein [Aureitalea sp. L0-47]MCW5519539.1 hypothetical protein [Aureitalea sp. L0-47]
MLNKLFYAILLVLVVSCSSNDDSVSTVPASVSNLTLNNIGFDSVTVNAEVTSSGGSSITRRGFCWSTEANPDINDSVVNAGQGEGAFSSTLTGLVQGTTYYVRAFAENANGIAYSGQATFETQVNCDANTYTGDVLLRTQTDVNNFASNNYCTIDGVLFVGSTPPGSTDYISDLSPLNGIQKVGSLTVAVNPELLNLSGLESIQEINKALSIVQNEKLIDLNELSSISTPLNELIIDRNDKIKNLGGLINIPSMKVLNGDNPYLSVSDNPELEDIDGLTNLGFPNRGNITINMNPLITNINGLSGISATIDALLIWSNDNLIDLSGISNLQTAQEGISLIDNPSLQSLDGLQNVTDTGSYFELFGNSLNNLSPLNNLTSVGGEFYIRSEQSLTDLSGLENLSSVGRLHIQNMIYLTNLDALNNLVSIQSDLEIITCDSLTDFCGLQSLVDQNGIGGQYIVYGNGYNPTLQDLIDGNCSL